MKSKDAFAKVFERPGKRNSVSGVRGEEGGIRGGVAGIFGMAVGMDDGFDDALAICFGDKQT